MIGSPIKNVNKLALQSDEYAQKGRTLIEGLIDPKMASNLTFEIQNVIAQVGDRLLAAPRVGEKPAYEIYGYKWWPMTSFHFALTHSIEVIVGKPLAPTYSFFRSYQQGDICRVHADRAACEHSMSLTLAYADGNPWALSVEDIPLPEHQYFKAGQTPDYGDNAFAAYPMQPGDAVLYKGVSHRHGRLEPNPNKWSAHMFLHWVETDGPFAGEAYDGRPMTPHGDIEFP